MACERPTSIVRTSTTMPNTRLAVSRLATRISGLLLREGPRRRGQTRSGSTISVTASLSSLMRSAKVPRRTRRCIPNKKTQNVQGPCTAKNLNGWKGHGGALVWVRVLVGPVWCPKEKTRTCPACKGPGVCGSILEARCESIPLLDFFRTRKTCSGWWFCSGKGSRKTPRGGVAAGCCLCVWTGCGVS